MDASFNSNHMLTITYMLLFILKYSHQGHALTVQQIYFKRWSYFQMRLKNFIKYSCDTVVDYLAYILFSTEPLRPGIFCLQ